MNNKGQSLVTFVILIPILLIVCGMVIEFANVAYQKHQLTSATKTIISSILTTDKSIDNELKNDIIRLYNDNNIKVDDLLVESNNYLKISVSSHVDSFLVKIINKDYYEIKVSLIGELNENNKVVFKKG